MGRPRRRRGPRRRVLSPAAVSAPPRTPFLGLRYFTEESADLFFGRDEEVDELIAALHQSRFVTVLGSSGSGKSSLVGAGLVPALRAGYLAEAGSRWQVVRATPGNDPIGNLAAALVGEDAADRIGLDAALHRGPLGLVEAVEQRRLGPGANFLVIADQFEELFRYLRDASKDSKLAALAEAEAAGYVKLLLEAAAQREVSIYVVVTMRSDFLGECSRFRNLPERINKGLYLVPRMRRDQLEQAIVGPVRVAEAAIQPRLVEQMLNDIGEDQDQLPVLQHALLRTWNQQKNGAPLDLAEYGAVGGLAGALGGHAEEIYKSFSAPQQHLAEAIFRRLTEVDESRKIRRSATVEDMAAVAGAPVEEVQGVIDVFAAEGVSFLRQTEALVDITHESLIRQWSRLREWARQEAADRKDYEEFAGSAATDLPRKIWLRGGHLDRAEEWLNKRLTEGWARQYGGDYQQTVKFIRRSLEQRDWERRRAWAVAGVFAVVAVVVAVLALVAYRANRETARINLQLDDTNRKLQAASAGLQRKADEIGRANNTLQAALEAEKQAQSETALQRTLGIWQSAARQAARDIADHADDDRTALLARQAMLFHRVTPDQPRYLVEDALQAAIYGNVFSHVLRGHGATVASVAFSPDGNRLASAGGDGTLRLWDLRQPHTGPQVLSDNQGFVHSVAFSPDGNRLASAGDDRTVRLWDLRQPQAAPQVLSGHQDAVNSVAFSPDGNLLASGSNDGTVRIWDLRQSAADPRVFSGHQSYIHSVAFSPDGNRVASASGLDNTVRVWDLRQPAADPLVFSGHQSDVRSVAFSPDGNRLASASADRTVRLWDLRQPQAAPQVLSGHQDAVNSVAFSPDGNRLASGSTDRTVRIWDLHQPQAAPQILSGHQDNVLSIAFSPDGNLLASASVDRTVRIWDLRPPQAAQVLSGHQGSVLSVAFSPDGQRLASGSDDQTVRLWDLRQPQSAPHVLSGHRYNVRSVAFSPDGNRLASAGDNRTVLLWDLRQPQTAPQVLQLEPARNFVPRLAVAFSPDVNHVAFANSIWNLRQLQAGPQLSGQQSIVSSVAFSPDGSRLAAGSADGVRIWDLHQPQSPPLVLSGDRFAVRSVAFSPDGSRLAAGGLVGVRIWDLHQPQAGSRFLSRGIADSVAFSPDGDALADGLRIWNLRRPEAAPQVLSDPGFPVVFSPDGNRLATGSYDHTVRVWPRWAAAADYLCTRVWRNLTMEEWRLYIGEGIPYERTCPNLPPGTGAPGGHK
jgi:WD40 repeat protein